MQIAVSRSALVKDFLRIVSRARPFLYLFLLYQRVRLALWDRTDVTQMPSLEKQRIIKSYARRFNVRTFVETGTYLGDTIWAMKRVFDKIYSIEIDDALYQRACRRFRRFSNVKICLGDSSEALPRIIQNLTGPCLFWLDAHFSGGITGKGESYSPVLKEIQCVFSSPIDKPIILIDDASSFSNDPDYCSRNDIERLCRNNIPPYCVNVLENVIAVVPE